MEPNVATKISLAFKVAEGYNERLFNFKELRNCQVVKVTTDHNRPEQKAIGPWPLVKEGDRRRRRIGL